MTNAHPLPAPSGQLNSIAFAKASEADRERFSYGQCMWFALAVHEHTQWPLEVVVSEDGSIEHAWVRMPDGQTFDVAGPGGADDFIVDPSDIRQVKRTELIGLAGGTVDESSMRWARQVFQSMLKRGPSGAPHTLARPAQTSAQMRYFGGFSALPSLKDTQKYMRGDCGHFALALHSILKESRIWEVGYGHFAVEDQAGSFWDVRGNMTIEELWSGLAGEQMTSKTRDETITLLNSGVYGDGAYVPFRETQAKRLIKTLLDNGVVPRAKRPGP